MASFSNKIPIDFGEADEMDDISTSSSEMEKSNYVPQLSSRPLGSSKSSSLIVLNNFATPKINKTFSNQNFLSPIKTMLVLGDKTVEAAKELGNVENVNLNFSCNDDESSTENSKCFLDEKQLGSPFVPLSPSTLDSSKTELTRNSDNFGNDIQSTSTISLYSYPTSPSNYEENSLLDFNQFSSFKPLENSKSNKELNNSNLKLLMKVEKHDDFSNLSPLPTSCCSSNRFPFLESRFDSNTLTNENSDSYISPLKSNNVNSVLHSDHFNNDSKLKALNQSRSMSEFKPIFRKNNLSSSFNENSNFLRFTLSEIKNPSEDCFPYLKSLSFHPRRNSFTSLSLLRNNYNNSKAKFPFGKKEFYLIIIINYFLMKKVC
jgi:hypothetical protein